MTLFTDPKSQPHIMDLPNPYIPNECLQCILCMKTVENTQIDHLFDGMCPLMTLWELDILCIFRRAICQITLRACHINPTRLRTNQAWNHTSLYIMRCFDYSSIFGSHLVLCRVSSSSGDLTKFSNDTSLSTMHIFIIDQYLLPNKYRQIWAV